MLLDPISYCVKGILLTKVNEARLLSQPRLFSSLIIHLHYKNQVESLIIQGFHLVSLFHPLGGKQKLPKNLSIARVLEVF